MSIVIIYLAPTTAGDVSVFGGIHAFTYRRSLAFYLSRCISSLSRHTAFGVILSLLFVFFVCTVEDISTQDGAIGVKFWLSVEQTPGTGTR